MATTHSFAVTGPKTNVALHDAMRSVWSLVMMSLGVMVSGT